MTCSRAPKITTQTPTPDCRTTISTNTKDTTSTKGTKNSTMTKGMKQLLFVVVAFVFVVTFVAWAQGTPPPTPLTLLTRDGRRPVPTTILRGQELIAVDDCAMLFQVAVREDTLAGGLTLPYRGRTVVVSSDQPMASVNGRVITLPSPAVRSGRRFLVPVEFLSRALAPIYDQRIELRRPQRLLLVGDVRVPRVTARIDSPGPPTRALV